MTANILAETKWPVEFSRKLIWAGINSDYDGVMNEPNQNPRRYKWPWLALAGIILGILLAILWMAVAVQKIERERDLSAPLPNGSAH